MPGTFSPPGGVGDLTDPADLQGWSDIIHRGLESIITPGGQLFNPLTNPRTGLQPRRIPWLAIPQTVYDHRPRDAARAQADDPGSRPDSGIGQNEYCEWFMRRDRADGQVTAVDVTTELGEYWAYAATRLTRRQLGDLVRQFYPAARDDDLFVPDPADPARWVYDPTNRWNTSDGALHLIGQINTLPAALGVVRGAVGWRFNAAGEVVDAQDCGAGQFHADPSLLANLNRLARERRAITLADPVGIYILDLDTTGWETPDGGDPRALVTLSRGTPPMRARVTVPPGRTYRLCDVRIDGEPIRWGSQVAERVVVGVVMSVSAPTTFDFPPVPNCGGVAAPPAPGPPEEAPSCGDDAAAGGAAAAAAGLPDAVKLAVPSTPGRRPMK